MLSRPFLASALLLALAGPGAAQPWPARQPIRVILPFSPGSSLDTLGRPVLDHVARQIGQSFVFEHRPGAGGTLGMAQVAKADDGYTLLLNSSVQTITPSTYTLAFDVARDFAGIAPLAQFPNVLVVPLSGFQSISDLVAAARAKPASLTFGSGGVGAATHLTAERFMLSAGIKAVHVPFKGAPDVLREILGGRLDFYFSPLASAIPLIESGQLRALAVTSPQRSPSLPDVPTTLEAGFPDSEYVFWIGAFAPAATPREIVQRLHAAVVKALADPEVQNGIRKLAAEPMPLTPEKFDAFISREIETNAALVKAAGITRN
ncbi:MAG TPA: tripartite tricarboxylate transporter substrate binding protein [Xanthobacteraceae bacterium]